MKFKIGQKIKLEQDIKTICCRCTIPKNTIIEIYSFHSLHGGRHNIKLTKRIAINDNGFLHHVWKKKIKGIIVEDVKEGEEKTDPMYP